MIIRDIEKIDIISELSKIRSANEREHKRRIQEVYDRIPEIKEIDEDISSLFAREARARIAGDDASDISEQIKDYSKRKTSLLIDNGFGRDYLEPIYTCPICQDQGYADGKMCSCAKSIRITELYKRSNLKNVFERENFSTFSLDVYSKDIKDSQYQVSPYQNASTILKKAKAYVENFDNEHGNILIYGGTGLGKTFISNCIAKELLDSAHSVLYLSANELFEQILSRYIMKNDKNDALLEIYEYLYSSDLLIIDDLGTEVLSSFVKSQLFEIINKRMLSDLSTIITTNLDLDTLEDRYTERVMSRIAENYVLYPLYGDDIRYAKTGK
ncbi:MAG: ATP-binding protein [Eubacterium sp.]|nr:ATP-binding protein [Eubacterium sp.]